MNKIKQTFLTLIIGDYILDELTAHTRIEMCPNPYKYLRNKFLSSQNVHNASEAKE